MKIIGGLLMIALGVLIVMQSEWLLKNFGRVAWFEKNLGAEGGSRLGYKLIGILVIFIGLVMATGMIDGFMKAISAPLTRGQL